MNEQTVSTFRVFMALLRRDVTVARRELVFFLIRTTMQPVLFVIIFGFLMPKMGIMGRDYSATVLPGVLAISLALSAIMSVSMPMVVEFGQTKEIEDRLLAPVPNRVVALEKIFAGVLQGIIAAVFVLPVARLIMGPIPGLSFSNPLMVVAMTLLGGLSFSAIGLFLGTAVPPQQVGMLFSVVLAPMMMFGCAYFPWGGLDGVPAIKYGVLINPLVYVSEGMRAALTPSVRHMPVPAILAALVTITALFTYLGLRAFMKRAVT